MSLKNGFNVPDTQGIFRDFEGDILFEYKTFGRDMDKPVDVIVTNLKTGKTHGPRQFKDGASETTEFVRKMIIDVLQEGSNFH